MGIGFFCEFIEKMARLGLPASAPPLHSVRQRTLNIFLLLFLIICGILTLSRLILGQYENVAINMAGMTLSGTALWFSYKGRADIGIIIGSLTLLLVSFLLAVLELLPRHLILPQLALTMAIFTFGFKRRGTRILFGAFSIFLIILGSYTPEIGLGPTVAFALQIGGFALAFHYLMAFYEGQDQKLALVFQKLEKANQELSNRNDDLIAFSSIMSHDLKSPLTSIRGGADILLNKLESSKTSPATPEETKRLLGFVVNATDSMTRLINDIFVYTQINSGREIPLASVDLNEVLACVHPLFEMEINIRGVKLEAGILPKVTGNFETLCTVFQNLIANAIRYQPKNCTDHLPAIRIWAEESTNEWKIFFQDNGSGIDTALQDQIFTHVTGERDITTGLGLPICHQVIKHHNGNITLQNSGPHGSLFCVTFPRALSNPAATGSFPAIGPDTQSLNASRARSA